MSKNWSLPERKLIAELCVGMARNMSGVLTSAKDGYYWHMATACFEQGCIMLWKLDVAVGATQSGESDIQFVEDISKKVKPSSYKFLSSDQIRKKVLESLYPVCPSTEEIISSYLGVVCDYGATELLLPTTREEFKPQKMYLKELDALANMGYLERRDSNFIWTDKITPAMEANYFWNESGSNNDDVQKKDITQECIRLLDQTPKHTKLVLAKEAKQLSQLKFMLLLHDQFDGLFMSKNPDGTKRLDVSDTRLVFEIQEHLCKTW